jgi:DNA-binding NarL/FixJ family response regulator
MATVLHDLGPIDIVAATGDPEEALDLVLDRRPDTLLIESYDGFVDRRKMLELFCRAAQEIPEFLLIAADLTTSRIELMHDSVAERDHLGGLQPLLRHEVS